MRDALSGWIDVELRPRSGETLSRQLTNQLRDAILKGLLPPGHRLPSSREFAQQLKISRNTVSSVIDQLAMEGYLDIARGRRPTVAASKPSLMRGKVSTRRASAKPPMSHWAERLRKS